MITLSKSDIKELLPKGEYSRLDAWVWMLSESQDGVLSYSLSELSLKWSWNINKVRSFLKYLEVTGRIEKYTATTQQKTQITICNSSSYNGEKHSKPHSTHTANCKPKSVINTSKYLHLEPAIKTWLEYKTSIKDSYKTQQGVDIIARKLWEWSKGDPKKAMAIVERSIGNNWKGLFELKDDKENTVSNDHKRDILRRLGVE